MFTFFHEKLLENDSAQDDFFPFETKWHEIGFYIN